MKELENREIDNTHGTKGVEEGNANANGLKKWEQQKSRQQKTLEVVEREREKSM